MNHPAGSSISLRSNSFGFRYVSKTEGEEREESRWSPALQQALDFILDSRTPGLLFWFSDRTAYYNDAARGHFLNDRFAHLGIGILPSLMSVLQPMVDIIAEGGETGWYEDVPVPGGEGSSLSHYRFHFSRIKNGNDITAVVVSFLETTRYVQQQKEAEELRLQLHFAMDAGDLGFWNLNPSTFTLHCNDKVRQIFALSPQGAVDLQLAMSRLNETDKGRMQSAIDAALRGEKEGSYELEFTVRHPHTGVETVVKAEGRAYFNSKGEAIRFSGILQDISATAHLIRRREKLQQLVEHTGDGMALILPDGSISYMNAAGNSLLQIQSAESGEGLQLQQFLEQKETEQYNAEILPTLQEQGVWSGIMNFKRADGQETIPCFSEFMLIRDPGTGAVMAQGLTLRDLRPEMAWKHELENSEKRFRNLVQEAPVATAIYLGADMTIQWANDAMIGLWGKDKSVIGKTVRQALPELEGQPFHDLLNKVFLTGEIYAATEDKGELVVDGELRTFYFNFSYKPLRDANGNVYGILNMAIDVTDSILTRKRLEEAEHNFRQLILQAPVGICLLTGDDFTVSIANDEYVSIVGRERQGFEGKPIWELLPEAKEQGFDKLLSGVKETGVSYTGYETEIYLRRNGVMEQVYVNFVYEPLFDEQRAVASILVTAIDVTKLVLARKLIENSEQRARLAIDSAKLGTYEVNLLTGEVISSQRFNELFDVDGQAQQQQFIARIHPDDMPMREAAHRESLKTGKLEYECRIITRQDETKYLRIFGQVYFEKQQAVRIVGIVQDVTAQKLAEEDKEKFLSLAHYSRDFIGMCDMNYKTIYVNRAGLEMLSIDRPVTEVSLWECFFPEDHRYLSESFFPSVIEHGYAEVEIRFRNFKTDEPTWVIYSVFVIRNAAGDPVAMATVSRDITERRNMEKELEERVKERTEQLTRLNQQLQQFTYVSSHDLKEPLRKIRMFSTMAREMLPQGDDRVASHLEKVVGAASRMTTLLDDLLHYSTLSNLQTGFDSVDLNLVFKNVMDDSELLITEKEAKIDLPALPTVHGIPFQINQLFYNLIQNAIKFSRPGIAPSIMIRGSEVTREEAKDLAVLSGDRAYYRIDVEDNGIGISEDFFEKIFVVFQRLHPRGMYPGNGIGLSICRKIAENHGGHISVRSTPGSGTCFSVYLPAAEAAVEMALVIS